MSDELGIKNPQLRKRNSLVENNMAAAWVEDVLVKQMDKMAFARSMMLFSLVAFFLGNDLNLYLWAFIVITIYMIVLRLVRWWVKRWLLYLFEFCYFGIAGLLLYLIFYQHNKLLFCTAYVYSTGTMAIAIVVFSNQATFTSTDHISSAWLHSMPVVTAWAIRWKNLIYTEPVLKAVTFDLLTTNEFEIATLRDKIQLLCLNPLMYWCAWAVYYVIVFYWLFDGYIQDPRYSSGLDDFQQMSKGLAFIYGDTSKGTKWKYLSLHLVFFLIGIPISWLSYHNYYFNTVYIILLMFYLFHNSGKQQAKFIDKKVKERLALEAEKQPEGS